MSALRNSAVKVKKGVPILPVARRYPDLATLEVGDCFEAPATTRTAFATRAKRAGVKVSTRLIAGTHKILVWRIR